MRKFVKLESHRRLIVWIGVAVPCAWFALVIFTLYVYIFGGPNQISALGQFGDTFGFLNALFTGVALIGLVYTALLQQLQLDAQREQMARAEKAAVESRESLAKQSREEFLSARLHAQTAVMQAKATSVGQLGELRTQLSGFSLYELNRDFARQRIAVELLLIEANQGFTSAEWEIHIQRRAIRELLIEKLRLHIQLLDRLEPSMANPDSRGLATSAYDGLSSELGIMQEEYSNAHPHLRAVIGEIQKRLAVAPDDPDARKWLSDRNNFLLSPDNPFWR
jgi:hypothetical protein